MKPKPGPENDESLSQVLRQWTVHVPLPPRFEQQVWQRIERAEAQRAPALWLRLSRLVEVVLPRPQFALAYLSVFLALGLAAGAWAAQHKTSRLDSQLSVLYVQSIDPYRAEAQP